VQKRYGDATALGPVDLSIAARKTTVLIGESGCGKSTLLRLLNGLIAPTAGAVLCDGVPLGNVDMLEHRRRIGYVIQDGGLFPHLTAYRNVALLARYLKTNNAKIDARIEELASLTHFPTDGLDRYPAQLSGGQRQRVSLMRALMLDPPILLLDEPLGALDPMIRADLQQDLAEIFRTLHKTVIMVTHDLAEAAYLGHDIILLRAGRVVQQGSIDDLNNHPAEEFVTRFIEAQRVHHVA